jgi:hypothetical protein
MPTVITHTTTQKTRVPAQTNRIFFIGFTTVRQRPQLNQLNISTTDAKLVFYEIIELIHPSSPSAHEKSVKATHFACKLHAGTGNKRRGRGGLFRRVNCPSHTPHDHSARGRGTANSDSWELVFEKAHRIGDRRSGRIIFPAMPARLPPSLARSDRASHKAPPPDTRSGRTHR